MPDSHQGYGMPIGGVIATEGVVIPNAVGVDIGCGMCAVKSKIKAEDFSIDKLKLLMGKIRGEIPVGFKHREKPCEDFEMPTKLNTLDRDVVYPICSREYKSAKKQLGTLGGGNHFIEIQKGDDGFIWIMIHSGSRNLGKQVADHYNKEAKRLNEKYYSSVDPKQDLAFIPLGTELADDYLDEMGYCLDFAYKNRFKMLMDVQSCFYDVIYGKGSPVDPLFGDIINIHHNYAAIEQYNGKDVVVHRKGATSARKGEIGIIPGSQGTASYIVEGLGNPESFNSCSHGAGRKMGRNDARRNLDLATEQKVLEEKGVVHSIRSVRDLDEASGAYKDIEVVMDNQKDLVKILVKLEPLGVIKG